MASGGVDLSEQITVFVITVGDDSNFPHCVANLAKQSVRFTLEVIKDVAPMSAAFQQMHDRCRTPFFVQVDEDMQLWPSAIQSLYEIITSAPDSPAMACAALWDCDVERPIYGVKIYRLAVLKQFPYENSFSCERTLLLQLKEAGHGVLLGPVAGRRDCLGEHGKYYTEETIFKRWQRLCQKASQYEDMEWVSPWPARLLERYRRSGNSLDLYAFLGAICGLTGPPPPSGEVDFRETNPALEVISRNFPSRPAAGGASGRQKWWWSR